MQKYSYEGKNYEEIMIRIKNELNVELEDVYLNTTSTEASLFKAKKYKVDVVKIEDVITAIKQYLNTLCSYMNVTAKFQITVDNNHISVQIESDNDQNLIGRDGKILNSIQTLLRHTIKQYIPRHVLITLDISNYKDNRLKRIEKEVRKIAREVLLSKVDASLDPMNPYERRYVHTLIDDYPDLTTESIGEGSNRHIVIKYVSR